MTHGRPTRPDATFDLVVCLFTSPGYFEDLEDDVRVVHNVARSLKPGGSLVVDVMGRETLKRVFQSRSWREEGGVLLLEDSTVSDAWDQVDNRWIIITGDERREAAFSLRVYSADESSDLLTEGGLEVGGTYGWFDGSPYDEYALRLIALARRPAPAPQ
ncbi:MAG: class I SAM-dependent methyltransferase [Actinobacteria bacterium]|nr:class I SAM-dependent methyltransferase [Actinomycetota bacterium]MBU1944813.1 class I SAM-dependent methyltransferase [Actinomycetota bacterium]MBU2687120.1 class I SAM-dependent methyltransferase [Actinomycetota bacterium]